MPICPHPVANAVVYPLIDTVWLQESVASFTGLIVVTSLSNVNIATSNPLQIRYKYTSLMYYYKSSFCFQAT